MIMVMEMNWIGKLPLDEKTRNEVEYLHSVDHTLATQYRKGKKGLGLIKAWIWDKKMWGVILVFYLFMMAMMLVIPSDESDGEVDEIGPDGEKVEDETSEDEPLALAFMGVMFIPMFVLMAWMVDTSGYSIYPFVPSPIERKSIAVYDAIRSLLQGIRMHIGIALMFLPFFLLAGVSIAETAYFTIKIFLVFLFFNGSLKEGFGLINRYVPRNRRCYQLKKALFPFISVLYFGLIISFMGSMFWVDPDKLFSFFMGLPLVMVLIAPLLYPSIALVDYEGPFMTLGIIIILGFIYFIFLYYHNKSNWKRMEVGYRLPDYLIRHFRRRHEFFKKTKLKDMIKDSIEILKFEFAKGIRALDSIRELNIIRNPANKWGVKIIVFTVAMSYVFYLILPGFGEFMILFMIFGAFATQSPYLFNHPMLRLIPERPESTVRFFIFESHKRFLKSFYMLMIPYAIVLAIPYSIDGIGEVRPPGVHYFLTLLVLMPMILLICIFLGYSSSLAAKNRTSKQKTLAGIGVTSIYILFIPYCALLLFSFRFEGLGLFPSFIIHILILLSIYLFGLNSTIRHSTNFLYNHTLFPSSKGKNWKRNKQIREPGSYGMRGKRGKAGRTIEIEGIPKIFTSTSSLPIFALTVGVILILLFIPFSVDLEINGLLFNEKEFQKGPIPYDNAVVYEDGIIEDQTLEPATNMLINGSVTISNSTLTFKNDKDGIYVLKDGDLKIVNSTITSDGYFPFEVYGTLNITDSNISKIWGDKNYIDYDGGIEIYQDGAVILNSTIHHCRTNGIMAGNAFVKIENTTFYQIRDDPIELRESNAVIRNCTIYDCDFGIFIENSNPLIENCSITNVDHEPIKYSSSSNPILVNNTTEWEPKGVDDYISPFNFQILLLGFAMYFGAKNYHEVGEAFDMTNMKKLHRQYLMKERQKQQMEQMQAGQKPPE